MKKSIKLLIGFIIVILLSVVAIYLTYRLAFDPYRGTVTEYRETLSPDSILTVNQAGEDLDYVIKMLRSRHPAWLEKDNAQVDALEARYLAEKELLNGDEDGTVTVLEEWQAIGRILHSLEDGHTTVFGNYSSRTYVNSFAQRTEYDAPIRINGEDSSAILDRFLQIFQYETEDYARIMFESQIIYSEVYLRLLGKKILLTPSCPWRK